MKILFYNKLWEKNAIVETESVPRVGDKVNVFYTPFPVVTEVIWLLGKKMPGFDEVEGIDVMIVIE